MRLLTLSFALVVSLAVAGLAHAAIVNQVPNGSFEAADPQHPDRPLGFAPQRADVVVGATSKGGQMTWPKTGHWGERSLSITNPTPADFGFWATTVPVKPGTEYTLSIYTRCQAPTGQPEIVVSPPGKSFKDPGGYDWYLPVTLDWNEYQHTYKTLPNQTQLSISLVLYNRGGQQAWFDDLAVVEAASLPTLTAAWPQAGAVLRPRELQFLFQPARPGDKYILQYARDPYFSHDLVQSKPSADTRLAPEQPLAPGTWYWHVGVLGDDGRPYFAAPQSFLLTEARTPFTHADTTPPAVFRPRPAPDSTVTGADLVITARFADAGSGTDVKTARLLLDGTDVTAAASITEEGLVYQPRGLADGLHEAEISIKDAAGNPSNLCHWQFGLGVPGAVHGAFTATGSFLLGGRPHFPVGLYSYCLNPGGGSFDAALLSRAADAGFTSELVEDTGSQATLDAFLQHGMKVMLQAGAGLAKSTDDAAAKAALVDNGPVRWKTHPGLLGYWADEPDRLGPEKLRRGYNAIKAADADHPALWCLCDSALYKQNSATTDGLMPDIYPVPSTPISVIYTQLKQAGADGGGKPIWFIPQAFDWAITNGNKVTSPGRWRPTAAELRAMTYLGVVAGARGIFFWASDTDVMNDIVWYAAQWDEALKLASELRYLGELIATGAPLPGVRVESSDQSVFWASWSVEGRKLLIVVNAATAPVECHVALPGATRVNCLFEDRTVSAGGDFRDLFRPYEVHVYEWR